MITISKKVYADLTERIVNLFSVQLNNPSLALLAIAVLDDYIRDGKIPGADIPVNVVVAFSMIRPEVDRAAERSRRARERAAMRRKGATRTACEIKPLLKSDETTQTIQPKIMKNRRERRQEERERLRMLSKVNKKEKLRHVSKLQRSGNTVSNNIPTP